MIEKILILNEKSLKRDYRTASSMENTTRLRKIWKNVS